MAVALFLALALIGLVGVAFMRGASRQSRATERLRGAAGLELASGEDATLADESRAASTVSDSSQESLTDYTGLFI